MSSKCNLLNNVTVIIRSTDEATKDYLFNQVKKEVRIENIFIINEKPFYRALLKTFERGISENKKYTLALDADLILAPNAVSLMLQIVQKETENFYVYQGYILDSFRCSIKQGGPHLYKTSNLARAMEFFDLNKKEIRPESFLYNKMQELGYKIIIDRKIFAIHDYKQHLEDIYRKGYFHGIKHRGWRKYLNLWLDKSERNDAYKAAIIGFLDGYFTSEKTYPCIKEMKNRGMEVINRYNLRQKLDFDSDIIFETITRENEILYDFELKILKQKKPFWIRIKQILKNKL
ncbi:hypothetical protein [uncultured Mesonia sp.]|uniref:hypothetical protein n=1 Tax=uncultured Mesonia sp. TaxID=399731 RepID=UPI00374EFEEE